ncbi:glycosyltransferase family 2 protein [Pseudoalteromonas undina]|uniref:Glycosyltransferase family 2 protein n=1 Tax=Pseudoalteromonas undina TaxID=43660 RepID=A0ACC6RA59_9GAMM
MKNKIVIVSHGHCDLIMTNECLKNYDSSYELIIKDNLGSDKLHSYCKKNNFKYLGEPFNIGFGANNNLAFESFDSDEDDNFFILNPDVYIDQNSLDQVIQNLIIEPNRIYGVNLFKDLEMSEFDPSARKFPTLLTLISSLLLKRNPSIIDKSKLTAPTKVDWIAGSFLAMKARTFKALNGFDDNYFMYCEDTDLCYRAMKKGIDTFLLPSVKAVHLAQHNNRSILSKHFFWHLNSAFKFLIRKNLGR